MRYNDGTLPDVVNSPDPTMAGTVPSNYPPVIFCAFAADAVPGHGELPRLADEQRQLRARCSIRLCGRGAVSWWNGRR